MAGKASKYTPATVDRIVNGIRAGLTNKDAGLVAGIHENTVIAWQKRHGDFRDRIAQAHAERSAYWLAKLQDAGKTDWRAYAELLDRCAPDYRKTERHEHTGKDGGPIAITGIAVPLPVPEGES